MALIFGLVLHLLGGVGVGAQGESCIVVPQHTQSYYDTYQNKVDWFMPQLQSVTYSRRVREYLEEIEVKLGRKKRQGDQSNLSFALLNMNP